MANRVLVSVIILCRNEASFVGPCIESVIAWDHQGLQVEVLVVDGMSSDGTRDIVRGFTERDLRVRLIDNPGRIKPIGLNIGIRAAQGEWIVRLDSHSVYPRDYLARCVETAQRTGADNVGGLIVPQLRNNTLQAELVQALTTHRFGVGSATFRLSHAEEGPADTVPYGCFRREIFDRIGYFDERLVHSQDFEFNRRLARAGGVIWLDPRIRVLYYNEATITAFMLKVLRRDGPWLPYMWLVAPYSFRVRHAVPILFVAALACSTALAVLTPLGGALMVMIAVSYALLAMLASFQQARLFRRWHMLLLLPWLFFVYHIAHGIGAWWGLLRLVTGTSPVQKAKVSAVSSV